MEQFGTHIVYQTFAFKRMDSYS